jgi:hypothetical protein
LESFKNFETAKKHYDQFHKGKKYKIRSEMEEQNIASKKAYRKELVKRTGRTVKAGAIEVNKRLAAGSQRELKRLKEEGLVTDKTAYDTRLREIEMERRTSKREVKAEDVRRLAEKRAESKYKQEVKKAQPEWRPRSPFGDDFEINQPRNLFGEDSINLKKPKEPKIPNVKPPFEPITFNPNANPWGFEYNKKKKGRK